VALLDWLAVREKLTVVEYDAVADTDGVRLRVGVGGGVMVGVCVIDTVTDSDVVSDALRDSVTLGVGVGGGVIVAELLTVSDSLTVPVAVMLAWPSAAV
jgi:hypothetical protein